MHEMEDTMITLQDCIAFSGLDTDDMRVIAAHYSLPEVVTAQFDVAQMPSAPGIARRIERPAAEARRRA